MILDFPPAPPNQSSHFDKVTECLTQQPVADSCSPCEKCCGFLLSKLAKNNFLNFLNFRDGPNSKNSKKLARFFFNFLNFLNFGNPQKENWWEESFFFFFEFFEFVEFFEFSGRSKFKKSKNSKQIGQSRKRAPLSSAEVLVYQFSLF